MLIKARSKDFGEVRKTILENHDYEVPEIASVRIDKGSAGYLSWMDEATGRRGSRRHRKGRPRAVWS